MKRIRVTVTEEYLIPDDWEIVQHPEDDLLCLHGDQYFMPSLDWAEREPNPRPGSPQTPHRGNWSSVDDQRGNWFVGQNQTSATEIRELA